MSTRYTRIIFPQSNRIVFEILAILTISAFVFLIGFTPNLGKTLLAVDSTVPKVNYIQYLQDYGTSWWPGSLGWPSTFHPYALYEYSLAMIIPRLLWQRVILFLPLLIASLSMFIFLKETKLVSNQWVRVIGSIFYGFNWITVGWGEGGGLAASIGMLQVYSWMPLFLVALYKLLLADSDRFVYAVASALALSVASLYLSIQVPIFAVFVSAPIVAYIAIKYPWKIIKNFPWLILSALFYSLLSFDFLLLYFQQLLSQRFDNFNVSNLMHGSILDRVISISNFKSTYPLSLSPLLSWTGNQLNPFDFLDWLLIVIMMIPLLSKSRRQLTLLNCVYWFIVLVLGLLMIFRQDLEISNLLFNKVIFLQAFFEPSKYLLLLTFWTIVVFLNGAEIILDIIVNVVHSARRFASLTIVSSLVFFSLAVLFGFTLNARAMFMNENIGSGFNPILSTLDKDEMLQYLDSLDNYQDSFRILVLPYDNSLTQSMASINPALMVLPTRDTWIKECLAKMMGQMKSPSNNPSFTQFARLLGIRYIVVVKQLPGPFATGTPRLEPPLGKTYWIAGLPDSFIQFMNYQIEWKIIRETSAYTIYQIGPR